MHYMETLLKSKADLFTFSAHSNRFDDRKLKNFTATGGRRADEVY